MYYQPIFLSKGKALRQSYLCMYLTTYSAEYKTDVLLK